MTLNKNNTNTLIETDNKSLNPDLVKNLKKKFSSKSINNILLIQPPDADKNSFNYAAGKRGRLYNYPPYGLGLLASQLRKIDKKVDILNLNYKILKDCFTSEKEVDLIVLKFSITNG